MEKKKYETPMTEIVNIGAESELLDWIITSIRDGQGDVDAQEGFFEEEEDWINDFSFEFTTSHFVFNFFSNFVFFNCNK